MGQVRKIKAGLVFNSDTNNFVGEIGNIFFDINDGVLRLSDGVTPGGIPLTSGGTEGGASTFRQLLDTPSSFSGAGGRFVKVNAQASALEFVDVSLFDGNYNSLSNLPTLFNPSSITTSLVPQATEAIDLGTSSNKWRDLYLSGSTIYLGNTTITADGTTVNLPLNAKVHGRKIATDISELDDVNGLLSRTGGASSYNDLTDLPDLTVYQLAASAFSGSYTDLTNKPNIPSDVNQLTDASGLLSGAGTAIGISSVTINETGHLILTYTNATTVDAGYVVGTPGADGADGADGVPGGFRFTYNSSTNATPGSGEFVLIRSNASFLSTTTALRLSWFDAGGTDLLSLYDDWDDSTSTNKALVTIQSAANNSQVAQFFITSTVSNSFNYSIFTVSFKGGDATFTNGAEYIINVSIIGDKGDPGTDGTDGVGISTATVNESGNLIITLTDASTIDAGYVVGPPGADGTGGGTGGTYTAGTGLTLTDSTFAIDSTVVTLDGDQTLTNKTLTSPTIIDGVFQDSFTIGQQVFIEHGAAGFSVNENFNIVGNSNFTGYHYTSGAGRTGVAFTLARTAQFTNGFGVHGTSSDNEFVIGSEFGNTDFVFKRNIGMPFDVSGGTEIFRISNQGVLTVGTGETQQTIATESFVTEQGYLTSDSATITEVNNAIALKANTADLATVAISGSYVDLINKPTIPTDISQLTDTTNRLASNVTLDDLFTYSLIF